MLYGVKNFNDSPFVGNICVAIKDSKSETFSVTSIGELNAGYQPKLFIGWFNSSKNNAILVSLATGGSGGVTQYSLLTNQDNKLNLLIPQKELNEGLAIETQCLPGFNLKLTDKHHRSILPLFWINDGLMESPIFSIMLDQYLLNSQHSLP